MPNVKFQLLQTICAFACAVFFAFAQPAYALSLIHDAEIESTLRKYGDPIFQAAGLSPEGIRIFIVNSPQINAYVAGGANMFLHTGLILAAEEPSMLIGVMAHETGHIAGGHIISGTEKLKNAQIGAILSTILGAAIMAGGGRDVGPAVIAGGQEALKRSFLANSRANENAADQAGIGYLDSLNISSEGMLRLFEKLRLNENRQYGKPDPYVMTHPLSTDRITHIRGHVMQSKIPVGQVPKSFLTLHARMLAKLRGFLQPPAQTFQQYPLKDNSVPARYARAVAYYKIPDVPKALAEIDSLIKESPRDAFFHELRGQILFENGKVAESSASYKRAAELQPNSALILAGYGQTLIERNDAKLLPEAIRILEKATTLDSTYDMAWQQLVIAYGKSGNNGRAYLARAELASLENNPSKILQYVGESLKTLPKDSPARLRAEDLKELAKHLKDEEK